MKRVYRIPVVVYLKNLKGDKFASLMMLIARNGVYTVMCTAREDGDVDLVTTWVSATIAHTIAVQYGLRVEISNIPAN